MLPKATASAEGRALALGGGTPPYLPIVLHSSIRDKHLPFSLYMYISHSILTGVAFCVYAVRCFVRIIERIRRIFVVFS